MVLVKKEGIVLEKTTLGFEREGVLNPGVIHYGDFIHIFYRAVAKGNYSSIGYAKFIEPLETAELFKTDGIGTHPSRQFFVHAYPLPKPMTISAQAPA